MKVMIYTFRNENMISGEKYTTTFLYNYLQSGYEVVRQEECGLTDKQSFWTFLSISKYTALRKISKNNLVDLLIVKIPTASQVFLIPLLTTGFKGKILVWVDGLMWEFPGARLSLEFLKREPLVFLARMFINNRIWSRVAKLQTLHYVVSSETQKDQFVHHLSIDSTIHVIPNAVPYTESFKSSREVKGRSKNGQGICFGYIGHSYPVKGLIDIKKSFELLDKRQISPRLELALSGRGALADDMRISLPQVVYSGMVDRSEFYARIDCLIFPYWADWGTNTFPSVLLESIELGIPVIVPDSNLSRELFGESGAIFYARTDYSDLANVIENLYLGNVALPSGQSIRRLYYDKLSKERIESKWCSLINTGIC